MKNSDFLDDILKDNFSVQAPAGLNEKIMFDIQKIEAKRSFSKRLAKFFVPVFLGLVPLFLLITYATLHPQALSLSEHSTSHFISSFYKNFYTTSVHLYNAILFSDKLLIYILVGGLLVYNYWSGASRRKKQIHT